MNLGCLSRLSYFRARQWTSFIYILYEYHRPRSQRNVSRDSTTARRHRKCDFIEMKIELFIIMNSRARVSLCNQNIHAQNHKTLFGFSLSLSLNLSLSFSAPKKNEFYSSTPSVLCVGFRPHIRPEMYIFVVNTITIE